MPRDLVGAPDNLFIGLTVVYTEWKTKPSTVSVEYVGPYRTKAVTKGQVRDSDWYDVWSLGDSKYVTRHEPYYNPNDRPIHKGRQRIDSVVLATQTNWTEA